MCSSSDSILSALPSPSLIESLGDSNTSSSDDESFESDDGIHLEDHTTPPDGFKAQSCRRKDGHFQQILREITRMRGYTLGAFLRDCIHYEDPGNVNATGTRRGQILHTLSHPSTRHILNSTAASRRHPIQLHVKAGSDIGVINKKIHQELRRLKGQRPFISWDANLPQTFDQIDIPSIVRTIEQVCPTWKELLASAFAHERSHQPGSRSSRPESLQRIIYMVTTMVMLRRSSQKAGFAAMQFGLFLRAVGMKDSGIDILSRFGLCSTAKTIREKEKSIEKLAKVHSSKPCPL